MLSFSKDLWHTNVPHNLSGNSMSHGALPCWHNKLSLRPSHRSHLMSEPEPKLRYFFSRALVLLMTCFMIKQKDNSAMFLLLLLFLDPTPTQAWVRTDCPEGKQISTWLVYTYKSFFIIFLKRQDFVATGSVVLSTILSRTLWQRSSSDRPSSGARKKLTKLCKMLNYIFTSFLIF